MRAEGRTTEEIESELRTTLKTIKQSCQRFRDHGLEGVLQDAPRSGRHNGRGRPSLDEVIDVILRKAPPEGARWSVRDLARECRTSPSTMHRLVRLHRIPLSRDDLRMMFYGHSNHPISDVAGLFLSPTLKAVAFQQEADACEGGTAAGTGDDGGHDVESATTFESKLSQPGAASHTSIHLMMARTDEPGTVTHLQIPVLSHRNGSEAPASDLAAPPEAVAFYLYKVLELVRALGGAMREMGAGRGAYDLDMLVFLECIDGKVPHDKDVSLVMNSLAHDVKDRVSTWLARHPRFRVSFFPDDELWLDVVAESANGIPDEFKRRATFKLEYMLANIAERGGARSRPIICYMQQ